MNIVFSVRVIITSMILMLFVVIPRILMFFGLEHGVLDMIISPWATFIAIFIALLVFFYAWLRNVKWFSIFMILALVVAFGLTFYFCGLSLPW